jgi:hypothetical protein
MNLHDLFKLHKHGYSKVTDHACREIRHGRISREEGLALVQKFENQPIKFEKNILDWLGITKTSLDFILNMHRNKNFWKEVDTGRWEFNGLSALQPNISNCQKTKEGIIFLENDSLSRNKSDEYITFGKGFP